MKHCVPLDMFVKMSNLKHRCRAPFQAHTHSTTFNKPKNTSKAPQSPSLPFILPTHFLLKLFLRGRRLALRRPLSTSLT